MRTTLMKIKFAFGAALTALIMMAHVSVAEDAAPAAGDLEVVKASSLDELLDNVEQRRVVESQEHSSRERRFAQEKANQAKMLQDAKNGCVNNDVQIVLKQLLKRTKLHWRSARAARQAVGKFTRAVWCSAASRWRYCGLFEVL